MIRINLLAEGRGAKRGGAKAAATPAASEGAPNLLPFIGVLLLVVLPVAGWSGLLYMQNQTLEGEVATKQKELERFKGVREKVQELEKRKEEYSAKVDQIKMLKEQQSMPVKLMNYLVEVLPEGAWYTKLVQKGENVEMEGKARSIKTISQLSDNLVLQKDFSTVDMGEISLELVGAESIYNYKVKFKYYPGGVKPADKEATTATKPAAPKPSAPPAGKPSAGASAAAGI